MVVVLGKEVLAFNSVTFIFGLIAGLTLCLSNILLLECLTHLDISVGSTIYRLNSIGVVIISVLILPEFIGWLKGIGIILGVIAVFLLYEPSKLNTQKNRLFIFYAVAISASLLRAIYGVTTKAGIMKHADLQFMLIIISSCWIVGGLLYAAIKEKIQHYDLRTSI